MKLAKLLSNFNLFLHKISFDKHKPLRESVTNIVKEKSNEFYDYGEGFFYQSIPSINLKGLRNTEKRIKRSLLVKRQEDLMGLEEFTLLNNKRISYDRKSSSARLFAHL